MRPCQQFRSPAFVPILLGFVCFVVTSNWAFTQQSAFDEEVIGKWKAYEVFSRSLQGTVRGSGALLNGKPRTFVDHYKQNRECASFSKDTSDLSLKHWFIYNPHYAASIKQGKEKPESVVLVKYEKDPSAPLFGGILSVDDKFFWDTSPHFCCCGVRLSKLVSKPEFSAKLVGKESREGHDLVRVDYDYLYRHPKTSTQTKIHGSAYFEPSRYWCIYQDNPTTKSIIRGVEQEHVQDNRYETIDHPSGFPIMKRWTRKTKRTIHAQNNSKLEKATAITDYDWKINDDMPNTVFTLSAFGLPEPIDVAPLPKPTRWYLWILAAAGASAALALCFAYLRRRSQGQGTASTAPGAKP